MWIRPKGAVEDRVILYSHGGGFVAGSIRAPEADDAIRRFAEWVRPKLGLQGERTRVAP
jgi:acetyl esterase/lipase